MKIGIFTDTFYPEINGVATSCLNLSQELERRGHEVHVYAPKCKGWEAFQSEHYHYLESAQFILLKDRNVAFPGVGTIRQALDIHFDVVHTNSEFVMGFLGRYIAPAIVQGMTATDDGAVEVWCTDALDGDDWFFTVDAKTDLRIYDRVQLVVDANDTPDNFADDRVVDALFCHDCTED